MTRRYASRRARSRLFTRRFVALMTSSPSALYLADDCLGATWPARVGSAATAIAGGSAPSPSAQLNSRATVGGAYSAPLSIGAGASITVLSVAYAPAGASALAALVAQTVGGAINTASSLFALTGNAYARHSPGSGGNIDTTVAYAQTAVHLSLCKTGQGPKLWQNSQTPAQVVSSPDPVAASDTLIIGALDSTGIYNEATTRKALVAVWSRELSAAETASILTEVGAYYGVAISA